MSRFYDALREANRRPEGNPADREWTAFAGRGPAVPAEENPGAPDGAYKEADGDQSAGVAESHLDQPNTVPVRVASAAAAAVLEPAQNGHGRIDSLAAITEIHPDESAPLIPHAADSRVVEHYRRLRTKILQQYAIKPFRTILVASPGPQEGKTVTVLNLAFSFAMLPSFKVLVVDGDLRRGSIGKWIGLEDRPGFSELIEGKASLEDVVVKAENLPVYFMLRGESDLPRAELLNSPQLGSHLRNMAEHFDLVLVDSPPVSLLTDAHLLAGNCDAVLLLARAFSTTRKALEQAVHELKGFRIIGTVLNGGTRAQMYRRYNGYYYDGK